MEHSGQGGPAVPPARIPGPSSKSDHANLPERFGGFRLNGTASSHDTPPALVEFLSEQTTNLLGGDPAWTRRLSPGIAYRQASS